MNLPVNLNNVQIQEFLRVGVVENLLHHPETDTRRIAPTSQHRGQAAHSSLVLKSTRGCKLAPHEITGTLTFCLVGDGRQRNFGLLRGHTLVAQFTPKN